MPCSCATGPDEAREILLSRCGDGNPIGIFIQDLDPGMEPLFQSCPEPLSRDDVSVVYLTPVSLLDDKHRLFDLGAVSVIAKPFLPSDLYGAIRRCSETWFRLQEPNLSSPGVRRPEESGNSDFSGCDASKPAAPLLEVLLVEDNEINQTVSVRMLQRLGCRVSVAEHGRRALEMLEARKFDVIFMDCRMPVMDGFEATRQIRLSLDERVANTPIIAITAYAMESDRAKCLEAGMNDYLPKPLSVRLFQNAILRNYRVPVSVPPQNKMIEMD
jgi:protein-histidine pros-kinase